jgi:hypothetical protein
MSPRRTRFDRERRVRVGRSRDRDRIDIPDRNRFRERRIRVRHVDALGAACGPREIATDERYHFEARSPQRGNVDSATETRADNDRSGH